jgi:tRNA pseudouridine38-40 synthase
LNRYKVTIAYKGERYCGYQYQKDVRTVESEILEALKRIYQDEDIRIRASGRTDAGVHAEGQVISFKVKRKIPEQNIRMAMNSKMPEDIRAKKVECVKAEFDPRRSAKSRVYMYLFSNYDMPRYLKEYVTRINFEPNMEEVNKIKEIILGEHDFESLRNLGSNEKSTVRKVLRFEITKEVRKDIYYEKEIVLYKMAIEANSFLYRMVRHIAGIVFEVLSGRKKAEDIKNLFENKKEKFKYTVAEAKGLCLVKVNY